MRILIDACVLYPTVMRQIVLGCAGAGMFTPLWSDRILAEWRHAALRKTPEHMVDAEIGATVAEFPEACVTESPDLEETLSLPDLNDRHVLAAAISGRAETLVTLNLKDFPGRTLARYDILPRHPDSLLLELHQTAPESVAACVREVVARFANDAAHETSTRHVLKRARLPRLGKAMDAP